MVRLVLAPTPPQPQAALAGRPKWTPETEYQRRVPDDQKLGMQGMWWDWWEIYASSGAAGAPFHSDATTEIAVEWPCMDRKPPPGWKVTGESAAQWSLGTLGNWQADIEKWAGTHAGLSKHPTCTAAAQRDPNRNRGIHLPVQSTSRRPRPLCAAVRYE